MVPGSSKKSPVSSERKQREPEMRRSRSGKGKTMSDIGENRIERAKAHGAKRRYARKAKATRKALADRKARGVYGWCGVCGCELFLDGSETHREDCPNKGVE